MEEKKRMTMKDVFADPKYVGKHVLLVEGKVYTGTSKTISRLWDKVRKKHPKAVPEYSFSPKGLLVV